jgi:hypothetical protein
MRFMGGPDDFGLARAGAEREIDVRVAAAAKRAS